MNNPIPAPITLLNLARCNPPQMNKIAHLIEIGHGGQDKDPKEFTLQIKASGDQIKSIEALKAFYQETMGEELQYDTREIEMFKV